MVAAQELPPNKQVRIKKIQNRSTEENLDFPTWREKFSKLLRQIVTFEKLQKL